MERKYDELELRYGKMVRKLTDQLADKFEFDRKKMFARGMNFVLKGRNGFEEFGIFADGTLLAAFGLVVLSMDEFETREDIYEVRYEFLNTYINDPTLMLQIATKSHQKAIKALGEAYEVEVV